MTLAGLPNQPRCLAAGGGSASSTRCATVAVTIDGQSHEINMGGVADAVFVSHTSPEMAALTASDEVRLEWLDAVFYTETADLGPVVARLRRPDESPYLSSGTVTTLNQGDAPFFPAENVNRLWFRFELPALGLVVDMDDPVINSAEINAIPPLNTPYVLQAPIALRANSELSTADVGSMQMTLESCTVKLMELKNIKAEVVLVSDQAGVRTYSVALTNDTSEDAIRVSWLVWPEPADESARQMGSVDLGRQRVEFTLSLQSSIFTEPRWLAVALAAPFKTSGATIAEL